MNGERDLAMRWAETIVDTCRTKVSVNGYFCKKITILSSFAVRRYWLLAVIYYRIEE